MPKRKPKPEPKPQIPTLEQAATVHPGECIPAFTIYGDSHAISRTLLTPSGIPCNSLGQPLPPPKSTTRKNR